ncbi:FAD binding domain-containing protein [Paenibacillus sp. sptzw28]|uniref:FAD binding domain-containing protein n=1 Tax=Paenibacillus sp. sptzw28 TaxID=715179 RepID=UPI001C6E4258|nr:FAD binding domain-containing protein [Paenibacillus sp. sptzw28]QYR19067.1 FAD binding domain-containing protein [Paenibacillus sp. sptzw28]
MATVDEEMTRSPFVWRPGDAAEAWRLKQSYGEESVYISGGTLLRTQWESGLTAIPKHLIDLGSIPGITGVAVSSKELTIGAFTTLSAIRRDPLIDKYFPMLTEAVRVIAAPSVRNLATLGGNIASLVGDSLPALLVYEAELLWHDGRGLHTQPLLDWLESSESNRQGRLLMQIKLPCSSEYTDSLDSMDSMDSMEKESAVDGKIKRFSAYDKVGRREAFTPSLVTTALWGYVDDSGNLGDVRLAAGGGQTTPCRLYACESLLNGRMIEPELLQALHEQILREYDPKGDMFASAEYRKQTAANVIAAGLWKQML